MFFLFLIFTSFADKKLIAQSVAMVDDLAITQRQVQLSEALDLVLSNQKLKTTSTDTSSGLARLLLETAAYREATEFKVSEVKDSEMNEVVNRFRSSGSAGNWSVEQIRSMVQRKLSARKFIDFKSESLKVPPTEEQIALYFQKNKATFGDLPFESFKANIKAFLMAQQAQQNLEEWYNYLKRKHRVRIMER